jgi:hypothetical protein
MEILVRQLQLRRLYLLLNLLRLLGKKLQQLVIPILFFRLLSFLLLLTHKLFKMSFPNSKQLKQILKNPRSMNEKMNRHPKHSLINCMEF